MFGFREIEAYAAKMRKMADAVGVDLTKEMQSGRLSEEEFDASVQRCLGCVALGDCQHFLASHKAGSPVDAPRYCRNKRQFEGMRAR